MRCIMLIYYCQKLILTKLKNESEENDMGRFSYDDVDNYGSSGGSSFFSLKNDGDVARVRFMYNDMNDVEGYAVHEVEVDGKRRFVNCLREYNEPKSNCPLCANGNTQKVKLYIPIYDVDDKEVKIWERGKNFFSKISSLCARYANGNTPLVSHVFEIERHGKKGDTGTTYEIYDVSCDETTLEDLPEVPDIIGGIVLDKIKDELEFYVNEGYFSNGGTKKSSGDVPVRRTPASRRETF